MKWQVPLGTDEEAAKQGRQNTGVLRAQRQSMVVTSSGVLFGTGKDGKVYAFDVDNGEELWSYKLPTGTEGIPAIYELNGKNYLVVCASTPLRFGRQDEPTANDKGSYIVFALPDKK
jgi:quinoprotein glucose dehydrogenase